MTEDSQTIEDRLYRNAPRMGASIVDDQLRLNVWAPHCSRIDLVLKGRLARTIAMQKGDDGVFSADMDLACMGHRYWLHLDGDKRRADPASAYQPRGVQGPSRLVDPAYPWTDDRWARRPLDEWIIYELHVGTFSERGNFQGVIDGLDRLVDLGITAIELMPIAQFSGRRNWGYDGVFPYAVQNSYGGPSELKRLINECHRRRIAVVLDVVFNHIGPEGNYLRDFGPYFTDRYRTPWGDAINYDGHDSDHVRRFFIQNALMWITDYHIDGLRLDAIQTIFDNSARPFLAELVSVVKRQAAELGRPVYIWGETDQNDVRHILTADEGGVGLDGVWNDDFHRAVHAVLTGERMSAYRDHGTVASIATAYDKGFVLNGRYSRHQRRHHGSKSDACSAQRFVVFTQNHDQVGNRLYGDRLASLVEFDALKLAAALTLLAPNVPMLFMGEEYAERAPFLYFVDHQDPRLGEAIRRGRLHDFRDFHQPERRVPNPNDESTQLNSCLTPEVEWDDQQRRLSEFYQRLLRLRREHPALRTSESSRLDVTYDASDCWMLSVRRRGLAAVASLFHFHETSKTIHVAWPSGTWRKRMDSASIEWLGSGDTIPQAIDLGVSNSLPLAVSGWSVAVFERLSDEVA